ncbi:hypothetical protein AB751O23_AB_00460, partial [Chlamydiales bacterium SCGC AB-751-O23]
MKILRLFILCLLVPFLSPLYANSLPLEDFKSLLNQELESHILCPASWKQASKNKLTGNLLFYIYSSSYDFIPPNINLTMQKNV